ncbi:MAG: hypothetical protein PHF67_04545 [Candidatus Nanoarchaeia archaeon]|nr:hypothetical protein [Candidatus Nanoarchaeia archaeon]
MEFFIKKIFDRKKDESVHVQFQKFSRGEFKDRAMLKVKNSNGKFTIDTTSEYARELIRVMAEKLGNNKTHVTGALISALELTGFKYESKTSAIGVRKYQLDREMTGKEIVELCDKQTKAFFGLSFNVGEDELKIKDKSPKSAKGASSAKKEDAELKIDFCKLKTSDRKIVESLIFEPSLENFKKVEIKHDFIITDIVIPNELKNEKDFAKVREGALRKGKVIRYLDIDGKKLKKEAEFEA